jgi:hypothetical protein
MQGKPVKSVAVDDKHVVAMAASAQDIHWQPVQDHWEPNVRMEQASFAGFVLLGAGSKRFKAPYVLGARVHRLQYTQLPTQRLPAAGAVVIWLVVLLRPRCLFGRSLSKQDYSR